MFLQRAQPSRLSNIICCNSSSTLPPLPCLLRMLLEAISGSGSVHAVWPLEQGPRHSDRRCQILCSLHDPSLSSICSILLFCFCGISSDFYLQHQSVHPLNHSIAFHFSPDSLSPVCTYLCVYYTSSFYIISFCTLSTNSIPYTSSYI